MYSLGLSPKAFRLITVVQAEVRSQFSGAEAKTECLCSRHDVGGVRTLREIKILDG